ncbi:hypothetical protein TSTA_038230 [Talaromyces stipitatus ATCC 10500]|uniref:Nephrocystin 3-like N-terminal domain-containing protein n=1 Tax=Talaromyces stipitatus (strain ATCC 10500 / CBS 375.48 / QM 6759 / NRRL 1006) TaxID=441959 RepID=B8M8U9_TALSN|nr:uncharacterized protein TSTA_038230 [Talaromyces stipitatus ATCC 10500]EED20612.1 hypothetical protein TSTA_038230 [Talaromyces stipitatus ATCC 10500]
MGVNQFSDAQEERQAFLEWISDVDFTAVHEEVCSKRCEDTGSWLLGNGIFKEWLAGHSSQVLWLNGGCVSSHSLLFLTEQRHRLTFDVKVSTGKSVLASVAINHLTQDDNFSKDVVVYAYFGQGTTNAQYDTVQVMSSLVKQLCWKLPSLPDPAVGLYSDYRLIARIPTYHDLKTLFLKCSQFFEHVFIVFDGLDAYEGKGRKEILKLVCEFADDKSDNLKILVASRRDPDILHTFRHHGVLQVHTRNPFVQQDIRKLVKHRVTTEFGHIDPELQEHVITTVINNSKNLYLPAELQLNDLARTPGPDIKRQLESVSCPVELEDIYLFIFGKINSLPRVTRTLAQNCFLWAFHSMRPLASGAFIDAVSLDLKANANKTNYYDAATLNDITFGLLDVPDLNMIDVKPIHQSLHYFMTHPRRPIPSELKDFFPDKETGDARMSIMCLRHLTLDIEPPKDIWDTCLFYCARYFDSHIIKLSGSSEEFCTILDQLRLEKLEPYLKRILAWRFTSNDRHYPIVTCIGYPKIITPEVFLKCTGIYKTSVIAFCYEIGSPEWEAWPADCLLLAAAVGCRDILETFISDGVDINEIIDRNTALHCAIKGLAAGYFTDSGIIKLLLDAGADWNHDGRITPSDMPPEHYETPLNTALSYYVDSAIEIIVNHESFNLAKYMKTLPEKHPDWVRVLVKHGADIE